MQNNEQDMLIIEVGYQSFALSGVTVEDVAKVLGKAIPVKQREGVYVPEKPGSSDNVKIVISRVVCADKAPSQEEVDDE